MCRCGLRVLPIHSVKNNQEQVRLALDAACLPYSCVFASHRSASGRNIWLWNKKSFLQVTEDLFQLRLRPIDAVLASQSFETNTLGVNRDHVVGVGT